MELRLYDYDENGDLINVNNNQEQVMHETYRLSANYLKFNQIIQTPSSYDIESANGHGSQKPY